MSLATNQRFSGGPEVDVAALAEIVRDLVAGGPPRLRDSGWLRERAEAAGLVTHERAALETLRLRLSRGGEALLETVAPLRWGP